MLSLVTIKACNPVVNAGEEADWLAEYQQTLRQVLTQATESNQHMDITEMDQFAANIRQAYIDVLGNHADMEAFENGYRMAATRDVRAKETDTQAESVVQDIIRESDTPEQALELLDELLASRDLDDSQRLEAINTREFLVFLAENSELITQLRASNVLAKGVGGVVNQPTCFQEIQIPNQETGTVTVIRVEVPCDPDDGTLGGGGGGTDWKCALVVIGSTGSAAYGACVATAALFALPTLGLGAPAGCATGALVGGFFALITSVGLVCL
ncbi:MAG: hypothetical protein JJU41_02955 [Bacteroidetes bacterium]|nr:hypothetical protein [Bacteroidota bacterium]